MTAFLEQSAQFSVLEVEGTLRAPVDLGLCRTVDGLLGQGHGRILLDLERVSDIDAAGIGELMRAYDAAIAAGGELRIAHANGQVSQLLKVAGVLALLSAPQAVMDGLNSGSAEGTFRPWSA